MAKRRQFSREFKAQVVLDVLTGVQSQAEVCRKHTLGANLLGLWKSTFLERAHLVFDNEAVPRPSRRGSPNWSRCWVA